jgi:Glyoxalase-like domain
MSLHSTYLYTTTPSPSNPTLARLDHIIILVPYQDLLTPPAWLTKHFTLTPGGRHADGKTANKLILFSDGSYIELIAFIDDDPRHRAGHWWGDKKPGIIDFAFTTDGDARSYHDVMTEGLTGLEGVMGYAHPVPGGRIRPDGVKIEWEVMFPQGVERGELPFFCHDVTPRELRVPLTEESIAHSCGAYGIRRLVVRVPPEKAARLAKVYAAVLGAEDQGREEKALFTVGRVNVVEHTAGPEIWVQSMSAVEEETEPGVLLGDLVLGGLSSLASGNLVQLDNGDWIGRIMLELDLPPGGSKSLSEWPGNETGL